MEQYQESKTRIQWQPLLELIIVLMTILGSTIPLYIHIDSNMNANSKDTRDLIESIRQDMKDFHGRLCAIEEKNKGK